ncbi:MAG: metalloregulator ArsR/SmtB family transcription factor [Candidatus Eisenbacteria bacterium]|nr:metalloregulator ArsR/SmtB family transcription factor [Candidatus Eisenbacteria bacterium]
MDEPRIEDVPRAAQFFAVLGDEARLRMLWLLFNHRELCVCDFVSALGITQSKASRHLRTLFHAALVSDRRQGLWSYYSLRPQPSGLRRSHLELLRQSLASCREANSLLESVRCCLDANRAALVDGGSAAAVSPGRKVVLRRGERSTRRQPAAGPRANSR